MSDLVPQTSKNKVLIYNTALNSMTNTVAIESTATTFGELKQEFKDNNIPFVSDKMSVMIGETKHTLEMDEAMLPSSSNYTIFMLPIKNKSGMATSRTIINSLTKDELGKRIRNLKASTKFSSKATEAFKGYSRQSTEDLKETVLEFVKKNRGSKAYFTPGIEVPNKTALKKATVKKVVSKPLTKKKAGAVKKVSTLPIKAKAVAKVKAPWEDTLKSVILNCPEPSVKRELQTVLLHYSIRTNKELSPGQAQMLEQQAREFANSIRRLKN